MMSCDACRSDNVSDLPSEMALRYRGLKNIDRPTVFMCPVVQVCLSCGKGQFYLSLMELERLRAAAADAQIAKANAAGG